MAPIATDPPAQALPADLLAFLQALKTGLDQVSSPTSSGELASSVQALKASLADLPAPTTPAATLPPLQVGQIRYHPKPAVEAWDLLNLQMDGARKLLRRMRNDSRQWFSGPTSVRHMVAVFWYLQTLLKCLVAILPCEPTDVEHSLFKKLKNLKKVVMALTEPVVGGVRLFELSHEHRNAWKKISRENNVEGVQMRVIVTEERMQSFRAAAVTSTVDWCLTVAKYCVGRVAPRDVPPSLLQSLVDLVEPLQFYCKEQAVILRVEGAPPLFVADQGPEAVRACLNLFHSSGDAFDTDKAGHLEAAVAAVKVLVERARVELERGIRKLKVATATSSAARTSSNSTPTPCPPPTGILLQHCTHKWCSLSCQRRTASASG